MEETRFEDTIEWNAAMELYRWKQWQLWVALRERTLTKIHDGELEHDYGWSMVEVIDAKIIENDALDGRGIDD